MKLNRFWAVLAALLIVGTSAFAQTSSNLTGRVTMDGNPLPGVTVTISSPQMQGTRNAVTDVNGNYNVAAIPPGQYTVKFEMESMQPVTRTARIGLGETGRADATMRLSAMAEAITVTASAPAVLETQEIETNVTQQLVEDLPIPRTFLAQANLAPNVTTNSPSGAQLVISGAPAHENLYMVNGAVINENLRGQIHNLFIEDAIQETTVMTGAISAEYGRFTGGVVNSITKSGGNEFSGSLRDSLTNPNWTAKTPGQPDPTDKINSVYEGTLGGRIVKDRLWFFTAGRYAKTTQDQFLYRSDPQVAWQFVDENRRVEAKLTGQITSKHSLSASYLDIKNPQGPYCFAACYELSNVDPQRSLPNSFATAHYSGIFTNNLIGEINYSRKKFAFKDSGGPAADFAHGTWGYDYNEGAFFGAPVFCSDCGAEERNNDYLDIKGTYYLASKSFGTHNIILGYQDWAEQRIANNYQSGSNFGVYVFGDQPAVSPDGLMRPNIQPGDLILWNPILQLTKGSDFKTDSVYVNDKWDLTSKWSFNLGLRYDKNHGQDAAGNVTARDSIVSPRLGATFDVFGNGRLRVNGSYAKYVAKIAETVGGGATGAGNPAYIFYDYEGPAISGIPTVQAFQQVYNWFQAQGGTDNSDLVVSAQFPGVSTRMAGSLKSPNVNEFSLGLGSQLGRGFVRADFISRDWSDFYAQKTTGQTVEDPFGQPADLQLIYTDNNYNRTYRAATIQASYPFTERLQVGGNYTYSKTRGNVTAETSSNGPVPEAAQVYPEFKNFAQNNPTGYLPSDQRNKVRAWVTWALPTPVGNFTFSALERYDSGTPYSALGNVAFVTDPTLKYLDASVYNKYETGPATVNYYFGQRGGYRWDNISAMDLSINYRLRLGRAEMYVEPELINAFNQLAVINGSTTVRTASTSGNFAPFNPFTDTPKECPSSNTGAQCKAMGANYQLSSAFGTPRSATDYATPRTYRLSVGVRF